MENQEEEPELPADPALTYAQIQALIGSHLPTVTAPVAQQGECKRKWTSIDLADNARIDVFILNCPQFPNRVLDVSFIDTMDNWARTTDHCGNIPHPDQVATGDSVERFFSINGEAGTQSAVFFRPATLARPEIASITFNNEFERPEGQEPANCADPEREDDAEALRLVGVAE